MMQKLGLKQFIYCSYEVHSYYLIMMYNYVSVITAFV